MRGPAGALRLIVPALAALAATAPPAAAAWEGKTAPNDPEYDRGERNPAQYDYNDEDWLFYSFIPRSAPRAQDPENAAGMSIDKAWAELSAGRPDVRIAYVEGGVNWRDPRGRADLRNKAYLNTGELPPPEGSATHDRDGDGRVSVDDYAGDRRVKRPYLNDDVLTPEDLIVAFSDGRDGDGNGYVDDISGCLVSYPAVVRLGARRR